MKVGILTFHRSRNYGAFLQAYSLCQALNAQPDIDAEIIDFQMRKEVSHYAEHLSLSALRHPVRHFHDRTNRQAQEELFAKDLSRMKLSSGHIVSDDSDAFRTFVRGHYDVIIVGSDEVWKTDGFRGFPTPYWLPGELGCRKFSYAASSRNDLSRLAPADQCLLSKLLSEFEFIGIRDSATKNQIVKFASPKRPVHLCCDPTFLHTFSPNREAGKALLFDRFGVSRKRRIVGIMTEDRVVSHEFRQRLPKSDYELVSLYQWQPGCVDGSLLSPFEWLDVLSALDILITSFFHAVCFAAKFALPLLAFGTRGKASKVEEMVSMTGRSTDYFESAVALLSEQRLETRLLQRISKPVPPFVLSSKFATGFQTMLISLRGNSSPIQELPRAKSDYSKSNC